MSRRTGKSSVAAASAVALLFATLAGTAPAFAQGGVGWELWPRGRTAPGVEQPAPQQPPAATQAPAASSPAPSGPGAPAAAERAGEAAGQKVAAGVSAGTVAKWAGIVGGVALIAVAVSGGSTSNH